MPVLKLLQSGFYFKPKRECRVRAYGFVFSSTIHLKMKRFILFLLACMPLLSQAHNDNTWSDTVAQVMYSHCTSCHHKGGIGGFSLVSYEEAYPYRHAIKFAVEEKRMPPWPADPDYREFAHQRVLSEKEIEVLVDWVDDAAPIGDATEIPRAPDYTNGAVIQWPDFKDRMEEYTSQAVNKDEYRCFVIPTNFSEDKVVSGIEIIPGNAEIVHHVLLFQDKSGKPEQLDAAQSGPGYSSFGGTGSNASKLMAGWVPGNDPAFFPEGMGIKLEKGASLVMQLHYPAGSKGEQDQTEVRLKFSESTEFREVYIDPILNHYELNEGTLFIPANSTKSFTQNVQLNAHYTLLSVLPHMHLLGKSINVNASSKNDTLKIIDIPQWDFHWQSTYLFPNPVKLPSGYSLNVEAVYDNTTDNPENPNDPPNDVHLGDGTTDEMMLVYFYYTPYQNGDENIDQTNLKDIVLSGSGPAVRPSLPAYPNPAKAGDVIAFGKQEAAATITLCDIKGQVLLQSSNSSQIRLPGFLQPGVYVLRTESRGVAKSEKLVVY